MNPNSVIQTNPVGIAIGLLFALGITRILWWMLRVPKAAPAAAPVAAAEPGLAPSLSAPGTAPGERQILVATKGSPQTDLLMDLALSLADARKQKVTALYVVELPMTVPLDAEVAGEMAKAKEILDKAQAAAKRRGQTVATVVGRARKAGRAIVQAAQAAPTDTIVLGASERTSVEDRLFGSTIDFVVRNAPCEVLIRTTSREGKRP